MVYGLIQGPEFGWTDPVVICALIVSVVVLVGWVFVEFVGRFLEFGVIFLRAFSFPMTGLFTIIANTWFSKL